MKKSKKPDHCNGCPHYHNAGHKKGSGKEHSKYNNWCCHFSNVATKAQSICKVQNFRKVDQSS